MVFWFEPKNQKNQKTKKPKEPKNQKTIKTKKTKDLKLSGPGWGTWGASESFWGAFGSLWESLGPSGTLWKASGEPLGASRTLRNPLESLWGLWEPLGGPLAMPFFNTIRSWTVVNSLGLCEV